jgi:FkbM family methyltransferase
MSNFITTTYGGKDTNIFVHDFSETISNVIRQSKTFFEIQFLDFILKNYPDQKEIMDIGANIGNHSLFFANFLNCTKVHSFEPFPQNVSVLKKNMSNAIVDHEIYDIALSSKAGEMTLYNSQSDNYGGFSLHNYGKGISYMVQPYIKVRTLDSFNLDNISMIKIDVENHENEVLDGARATIKRTRPIIFIENLSYGYPNVCPDPNPHRKILEELGYVRTTQNIHGSFMDLWKPNNS